MKVFEILLQYMGYLPDTILRISEFGGKDKQNQNDYDYSYDRFSYALKTQMSASALIPWRPLKGSTSTETGLYVDFDYWDIDYTTSGSVESETGYNFPNTIQFRFKTPGIPTNTRYSQSIFVQKNPSLEGGTFDGTGCSLDPFTWTITDDGKVLYNCPTNIGGFQIDNFTPSLNLTAVGGGELQNAIDTLSWNISLGPEVLIGFSFIGTTIDTDCGLMTQFTGSSIGAVSSATGVWSDASATPISMTFIPYSSLLPPTSSFNFGVFLTYDPSVLDSGSYSGSVQSAYKEYGNLELVLNESTGCKSSSIYLPFYDGGWWSGMLTQNLLSGSNVGTYTLHAGNNIYNGPDGDQIGFNGSTALISTDNSFWTSYNTSSLEEGEDGIWYGGYISGSTCGNRVLHRPNTLISGSLQEFRYSSYVLGKGVFDDFVMNPESIEGMALQGPSSSFNIIDFRAPFGNELQNFTSSITSYHTTSFQSVHPAIRPMADSLITQSFLYQSGSTLTSSSLYRVIWQENNPTGSYTDKHKEVYYLDQPVVGLKNRITEKIHTRANTAFEKVLSNQISIQQNIPISASYIRDVNILEVAFSPQNEINDDIIQTYGYFNIGEFIGDPRFVSESNRTYLDLDRLQRDYFKKYYTKYDWFDYIRIIKYLDNSLFKMIKDYVPARTSLNTGVVIKQHMLERNRQRPAQVSYIQDQYTSSIEVGTFSGGAGGSVNKYNTSSFNQCWTQSIYNESGTINQIHCSQEEFYNGEYDGSKILVLSQSLNGTNPFLIEVFTSASYKLNYYNGSRTSIGAFLHPDTTPNSGDIYLWNDAIGSSI